MAEAECDGGSGCSNESVDEDTALRISVVARGPADVLDLSAQLADRVILTLRGSRWNPDTPTSVVPVRVLLPPAVRYLTLRQQRGFHSALVLDGPSDHLEVHVDCWGRRGRARLVLEDTQLRILTVADARVEIGPLRAGGSKKRTIDSITLNAAEAIVTNRNVSDVRLVGDALVQFPGTPIGLLLTTPGCRMRDARHVNAKRLVPLREVDSAATDLALLPGSCIVVEEASQARIVAQEGARLTVDRATALTFRGPGTIEVRQWGRNLAFDGRRPVLDLDHHATVGGLVAECDWVLFLRPASQV